MGSPLTCPRCGLPNGLLVEECRCGHVLTLDGSCSRVRGTSIPSASFETEDPTALRAHPRLELGPAAALDAHTVFRYCLLLRAAGTVFQREDGNVWFDDCLFFLTGGYPFFCHINLRPGVFPRARVFGGLNHARRPSERVKAWIERLLLEARERGRREVDLFVLDEAKSGTGANRFMKLIREHLASIAWSDPVRMTFHHLLITPVEDSPPVPDVAHSLDRPKAGRRDYREGAVTVTNRVLVLRGPILTYDDPLYCGLGKLSAPTDEIERYQLVKYSTGSLWLTCGATDEHVFVAGHADDAASHAVGMLALELLGSFDVAYGLIRERVEHNSCEVCKRLFDQLRGEFVFDTIEL